jgi:serine/threonine-protein kinase
VIGKTLAHYKIVEKIGAGGMGEVYRASDSRLGRDVALKILPDMFAKDPERMARFQREAQVLAQLNHPNIAAIYGLEKDADTWALALELVEGPTLADRIRSGPMPVDEVLQIARQITMAIETAHESGIIHRDVKPANVKLTPEGDVKVLDFGLAKALEGDPLRSGSAADSPTISPALTSPVITGALTGANVILGTAAYMSPEQARGKPVDKRCDIWSFGVVLFEMLTGQLLFAGETISDTLASVLKTDPDWDRLPTDLPPRIHRLLRRCIERDPRRRLRDIGEARLAIEDVLSGGVEHEEPSVVGVAPVGGSSRRPWLLPVVALAAAAVTYVALTLGRPADAPEPLRKYEMTFPDGTVAGDVALAPDASALAYVRNGTLVVKELTTLERHELDATGGIVAPVWSPDGEWIAYGVRMGLWKVRRTGGTPVRIATAPTDGGFSEIGSTAWREDGRIYFTTGDAGLFAVSAQGGELEEIVPTGESESDFHEMADLEGRGLAFIVHSTAEERGIDAIDVVGSDGVRRQVVHYPTESLHDLAWSPTGHLLFRREDDAAGVWAIPLSLSTFEAEGAPFLVAPLASVPSLAADGTLLYVTGSKTQETLLALVDRNGVVQRTIGEPASYHRWPTVSPDGRQIANSITEGETRNLWFIDVERGSRRRFSRGPGLHTWGSWDPTGREFWFHDEVYSEEAEIYVTAASGTGDRRVVAHGHGPAVSPDGRWLMFNRPDLQENTRNLWLLDLSNEEAEPRKFIEDSARQWTTLFSPTSPLVAYDNNASGQWEVHVTTYPEPQGDWPASTRGGMWPQWSGDGRELFYAVGDSIMAVEVEMDGESAPRLSRPELLFRRPRYAPLFSGFPDGFTVMADGQTFVLHVTSGEEETAPPALVVTKNWIREFRDDD